jgi:hypothetical protein
MSADEKLGTAAQYLASQVTSKKADVILPTLRSIVCRAGLAAVRSLARKANTEGTTPEDER